MYFLYVWFLFVHLYLCHSFHFCFRFAYSFQLVSLMLIHVAECLMFLFKLIHLEVWFISIAVIFLLIYITCTYFHSFHIIPVLFIRFDLFNSMVFIFWISINFYSFDASTRFIYVLQCWCWLRLRVMSLNSVQFIVTQFP